MLCLRGHRLEVLLLHQLCNDCHRIQRWRTCHRRRLHLYSCHCACSHCGCVLHGNSQLQACPRSGCRHVLGCSKPRRNQMRRPRYALSRCATRCTAKCVRMSVSSRVRTCEREVTSKRAKLDAVQRKCECLLGQSAYQSRGRKRASLSQKRSHVKVSATNDCRVACVQ